MPSGLLRIILQAPDGTVAVDAPVQQIADDREQLAAHLARLEAQGFAVLKSDATGADLPNERAGQSRRFRNAWRWDGAKIEPDLTLCRAQILAEVRAERNARLAAADGERGRLADIGTPPQQQAHAAYRQALRDLPAAVQGDLAALATPEGLEAYAVAWPSPPES